MHSELAHALQACAALDADDPLQVLTRTLLDTVECRLQQRDIGLRPALPDRHKYLNKLAVGNPRRPQRATVFAAMDGLLAAVWVPMTVAARKQRSVEKRKRDAIFTLPNLAPSPFQLPSFGKHVNPWSDCVPPLSFPAEPGVSSEWWHRLKQKGLSPGHTFQHSVESQQLASRGCDRRHSV